MSIRRIRWLLVAAVCASMPGSLHSTQQCGAAFDGGGGGSVNPSPPNSILPVAPTFTQAPGNGRVLLMVWAPARRVVVVRSRAGELLDMAVASPREPLLLRVPAGGALLDLLGTDVVGLPVVPGQALTVVDR